MTIALAVVLGIVVLAALWFRFFPIFVLGDACEYAYIDEPYEDHYPTNGFDHIEWYVARLLTPRQAIPRQLPLVSTVRHA